MTNKREETEIMKRERRQKRTKRARRLVR